MSPKDKPLAWLHGEVKTPPFSSPSRQEAGVLLRRLQKGEKLTMPESESMPEIGGGVHQLRIKDLEKKVEWRIVYRLDSDAIVIGEVFEKKTRKTPKSVIAVCKRRFSDYDAAK